MILTIYTDGGSLNNPGQAAYAYVIYKDKALLYSFSEPIGIASNNTAEYMGLIKAFEKVKELKNTSKLDNLEKIHVNADSQLMINQLNGVYKVKNTSIKEYVFNIRFLENEIAVPISYTHIYREKNELADSLVKKALGR